LKEELKKKLILKNDEKLTILDMSNTRPTYDDEITPYKIN